MKTQAWGWLTAAVVAAGLNASYHDGGMEWAHQIADRVQHRVGAVVALATGNADQFLTEARFVATPREDTPCRFAAVAGARTDVQFDRFEAFSDRQQARLARLEANHAQLEARLSNLRIPMAAFTPVVMGAPKMTICPRVRVNMPRVRRVKIPALPVIHMDTPGAGPV